MKNNNTNDNFNYFGVKHYKVKVIKEKIKPLKFITSVISYALFIWLLLIGVTLLIYVADIKIRAAKGDNSPPTYNAYVVLTGSMVPEIMPSDVVVTKKRSPEELEVGDIITFTNRDTLDTFDVEVINLYKYNSFKELYDNFDKTRLGYEEYETAKPEDMGKYYPKEEMEEYGVVGIEIKKIDI